jgi:hypothetical protein
VASAERGAWRVQRGLAKSELWSTRRWRRCRCEDDVERTGGADGWIGGGEAAREARQGEAGVDGRIARAPSERSVRREGREVWAKR